MTTTENSAAPAAPARPQDGGQLPLLKLLIFAGAGFLAFMTETTPAGLLPRIAHGLDVSEGLAGQLVTLYALGSVVAAIPVITLTRGVRRKPLLLSAIAGLFAFNTVTAVSHDYALTLGARFLAGMASGVVWGLLAGYARRLVPEHLQGRALAVVSVGQPVALALGIPLATWLGSLVGWQGAFWVMSALALLLLAAMRALVPDYPGQAGHERLPLRAIATLPGIRPILLIIFLWTLAHNILYTYVAPFLDHTGLGGRVGVMLLVFGATAIAGIWFTGALVDRKLRALSFGCLLGFGAAALCLGIGIRSPLMVTAGVVIWGLTFGGSPALQQTALADAAGDGADVAQSMLVTVCNLAVAAAGVLGGLLLETAGVSSLPWALLVLTTVTFALVAATKEHGFTPGARGSA
ncbi:MFS transporter [Streptomyces sp. IBSBF 2435]|uniref:MFS transporter n=1 Tax=Streptomyces sp. IBSBF 2435 TaxID=2903531 RepID=UPI002FDC3CF6